MGVKRLLFALFFLLIAGAILAQRAGRPGVSNPFFVAGVLKPAGSASSLLTGLTGYWKLDEASGSRSDSTANALTLTDSASTSGVAAKISNGADFEFGTPTYLNRADEAALSFGTDTDFTVSCWIQLESSTGFGVGIVSKDSAGLTTGTEFLLDVNSSPALRLSVGNGTTSATVTHGTTLSTATWYFVVAWHDSAADTLNISVNDGAAASTAWTGGTQNGTAAFRISAPAYNNSLSFDGIIDEVGFWNGRVLTAGERTTLYNGGSGLTYPF
jgi:hypothetical protein